MERLSLAIGFFTGALVMWSVAITVKKEWEKDLEKLKDFEVWKEWKNKK